MRETKTKGSEVAVIDRFGRMPNSLKKHFRAVSVETRTFAAKDYRDDLFRVFVDVPDVPESRQFFVDLKERLKVKFQQEDIWMTTYPIEII